MEPGGEDSVFEAILRRMEVTVAAEIDDTRLMGRLDVKKQELEMRKRKKAQLVASKESNDKLVTEFLQAENTKDFEKQKAMKDAIANSVNPHFDKLLDAFLDGDAYNNSDDPKIKVDALLAMVKSDNSCSNAGLDISKGEGDKSMNPW